MHARAHPHSRREWLYWACAVVALGVVFGTLAVRTSAKVPTASLILHEAPRGHDALPNVTTPLVASPPVHLSISALSVSTNIVLLGLQPDHEVMVPNNVTSAGWFRYGPTPGQLGSSVILGHVDSYRGPGVFFSLKTLLPGAIISVRLKDGVTTYFRVTRVVEYSKTNFPDALVYGPQGTRSLNLVTCGGAFDRTTGHYESNIVVFSDLLRVTNAAT